MPRFNAQIEHVHAPGDRVVGRINRAARRGAVVAGLYGERYGRGGPSCLALDVMVDLMHWVSREGLNPEGLLLKAAARYAEETR